MQIRLVNNSTKKIDYIEFFDKTECLTKLLDVLNLNVKGEFDENSDIDDILFHAKKTMGISNEFQYLTKYFDKKNNDTLEEYLSEKEIDDIQKDSDFVFFRIEDDFIKENMQNKIEAFVKGTVGLFDVHGLSFKPNKIVLAQIKKELKTKKIIGFEFENDRIGLILINKGKNEK